MASFVALYVNSTDQQTLLRGIDSWLAPFGFDPARPFTSIPPELNQSRRAATCVGSEPLAGSWHIVLFNSHSLGRKFLDETLVQPLIEQLAASSVLFTAQTTSDVYQLAVFDRGKLVRHVLHAEGDLLETFGSPIPGERVGAFRGHSDDEDEIEEQPSVLDDAHALCAHLGFELWRTPPVAGPGHSWTRRPFLSRLFTRNPA